MKDKEFIKRRITNAQVAKLSNASNYSFPKYTTRLINDAGQISQATRPKYVGQMSELIQEFDGRTLEEWIDWYNEREPNTIDEATEKIYATILKLKEAIALIDKDMVRNWVKDLIYTKTFCGLKVQQAVIAFIASDLGKEGQWRLANKAEEAKGIDGYIGDKPVQVKASTYKSERQLKEVIDAPIVYYEKKENGFTIEYSPEDFK